MQVVNVAAVPELGRQLERDGIQPGSPENFHRLGCTFAAGPVEVEHDGHALDASLAQLAHEVGGWGRRLAGARADCRHARLCARPDARLAVREVEELAPATLQRSVKPIPV